MQERTKCLNTQSPMDKSAIFVLITLCNLELRVKIMTYKVSLSNISLLIQIKLIYTSVEIKGGSN